MSENRNFWRGPLIRLRALEERDWEPSTDEPDTELDRYIGDIGFPESNGMWREQVQDQIKQMGKEDYIFLQIENLDGQVVGFIHSHECNQRNGTFRYAIGIQHKYWGRGYAREAVTIFLRYFFRERRYQKCTTPVCAFNERSIRFHEKLGFRLEGRLRNMIYTNGEYFDELYFGVTAAEWEQIDPPLMLERAKARDED